MAQGMFLYQLAQQKRAEPADDMLSALIEAEVETEDGELTRLDDTEIAGFGTLLAAAGSETVTKLVGNAVVLFHRKPRPVGQGARRPRHHPQRGGGGAPLLGPLPVPGPLLHGRLHLARHNHPQAQAGVLDHRGRQPGSPPLRRPRPLRHQPATPAWPSAWATASTSVWARPWPAWRAGWPSRRWPAAGRPTRCRNPVCAGCRCPTWPATPRCRSPSPSFRTAPRVLRVAEQPSRQIAIDRRFRSRPRRRICR